MTEIVLSSLLNLFALFGKGGDVDVGASHGILKAYMRRHFGIRNTDFWLGMYDDLRELYAMTPDLDVNGVVENICTNLHGKIPAAEEAMMVLRLMEFCGAECLKEGDYGMLHDAALKLHVSESVFQDFVDFVLGRETDHVHIHKMGNGELKVLLMPALNRMVFTWLGDDELLQNDVPVLPGTFQVMQKSGVLKCVGCNPVYYSTLLDYFVAATRKDADNRKITFTANELNFRFPNSDNGMHNMSFTLESGTLLAIMGGSGTGKSTLMGLLNGSITPSSGSIEINGHSIQDDEVKKLIGFVPQDDLLIEELTVRENLWYTARLCFEGMSDKELNERVDGVLRDLGLEATADLKVGSPINKFISGGQRKRLNIALELIREPAVLFLDEPTSGLSSTDTEKVINLLKEQTYRGKLIVVNIHQPSSDVYKLFDRLWLLDRGGYPVYDGNPIDAITYFKSAANYADAETSMCPTCGNVNPEIVLNIIDEKALTGSGEVSEKRKVSPQEWHELYLGKRQKQETAQKGDVPHSNQKRPNGWKQFVIFLERNIRTKITNVQYLLITSMVAPLLAVICAMLTRFAPESGYTLMENKNFVSYIFMAVIVATFVGMSGSAEEIIRERALLRREKFLQLNNCSYIASKIVFSAIVSLIQTFLFVLVGNSIIEVHGLFLVWWGVLFSVALLSNLIGLLLSQCMNSVVAIYITIPILLIPQILLCGVVVNFNDLTPHSTTGNVPVVGNLIPSRWAYEALAVTTYTDNEFTAPYFEYDKDKYETQFYIHGYLWELQSQIETMRDEARKGKPVKKSHLETVHRNLGIVSAYAGIEPYRGNDTYEEIHAYLKRAEDSLFVLGNRATLQADRILNQKIRSTTRDEQERLKKRNTNSQLTNMVTGAGSGSLVKVVNNSIVPLCGFVYLTPLTHCGNAPFYSSEKLVGKYHIKTLWFNTCILYIMCIVMTIMLMTDIPGRFISKENNN